MIKTILFDADGTLLDTKELIIETLNRVFAEIFPDVKISREEKIKIFFGPPLNRSLSNFVKTEEELENAISVYRRHNIELHDSYVKAFAGAKDTLRFLKKNGIKTGVVSSKFHAVVKKGLILCGIDEYIDVIIGLDDCDEAKPSAAPILKAIEELKSKPKETLYVGDHVNDIEAGKRAGVSTCAVTYSDFIKDLLAINPNYVIDELRNLKDIF